MLILWGEFPPFWQRSRAHPWAVDLQAGCRDLLCQWLRHTLCVRSGRCFFPGCLNFPQLLVVVPWPLQPCLGEPSALGGSLCLSFGFPGSGNPRQLNLALSHRTHRCHHSVPWWLRDWFPPQTSIISLEYAYTNLIFLDTPMTTQSVSFKIDIHGKSTNTVYAIEPVTIESQSQTIFSSQLGALISPCFLLKEHLRDLPKQTFIQEQYYSK